MPIVLMTVDMIVGVCINKIWILSLMILKTISFFHIVFYVF